MGTQLKKYDNYGLAAAINITNTLKRHGFIDIEKTSRKALRRRIDRFSLFPANKLETLEQPVASREARYSGMPFLDHRTETIYEIYMSITQKPAEDMVRQRKNVFYKSLANRVITEHGNREAAREALEHITVLLKFEGRMGNIRHKYPTLEKHEIVELLYDKIKNI